MVTISALTRHDTSQPNTMEMPPLSQCSPWLCMNVLSLSDKVIFCEETEKGMIELFNDQGEWREKTE